MAEKKKQRMPKAAAFRLFACLALMAALIAVYLLRTDATYAVHVWPMWAWTPAVLIPWTSLRPWRLWKGIFGCLAGWVLVLFLFGEPAPQELIPADRDRLAAADLRVVSLNCAGGMITAAEEVFALDPDVVLFQESPGRDDLMRLAEKHWGTAYLTAGPDASVLSKTPLTDLAVEPNFVHVRLDSGLEVVSLRLAPPVLRFDLYSPSAWASYRGDIERRAAELTAIRQQAPQADIVGGDFNTPNSARIGGILKGMKEAEAAIHGWGATAINDYPLVRIDQIWSSRRLIPASAFVVKSVRSDHRLSVVDYALNDG